MLRIPDKKPVLQDILSSEVDKKYTLSDGLWSYLMKYADKHKEKGNGFGYGMPDINGIARTLSARYYKDGSEILIRQQDGNPRKLTPRECARLQGYGDDFKIIVSDTQAYKQFGNSVVVPLVEEIAHCIVTALSALERSNTNSVLPVSAIKQSDDLPEFDAVNYPAAAML
jgi:DNA (cytosine-5)-methyltransferase 1